jgi:hypothetical protein
VIPSSSSSSMITSSTTSSVIPTGHFIPSSQQSSYVSLPRVAAAGS